MKSFLTRAAKYILSSPNYQKDNFFLPTQKAVFLLRQELNSLEPIQDKRLYVSTLRDFTFKSIEFEKINFVEACFELYPVYQELYQEDKFENFIYWANLLLRDFEDIDLAAAPAEKILANVAELQKIDAYVQSFGEVNPSEERKRFFFFWDKFPQLYFAFQKRLMEAKKTYYGHALKILYENFDKFILSSPVQNYHFLGFADLQNLELQFIQKLTQHQKANFLWNFTSTSVLYPEMESNKILSKNKSHLQGIEINLNPDNHEFKQDLILVPCKHSIEQKKILQYCLHHILENHPNLSHENIVIILNNKQELIPTLLHIPDKFANVNISMGLSFVETYFASLVELLFQIKIQQQVSRFYFLDYQTYKKILKEPHLTYDLSTPFHDVQEFRAECFSIEHQRQRLEELGFADKFIGKWLIDASPKNAIALLSEWLQALYHQQANAFEQSPLRLQEIYHLALILKQMKQQQAWFEPITEWKLLWNILKTFFTHHYIPFEGQPHKGLQFMELVETQNIDYSIVIFLDFQEGNIPPSPNFSSFIPMELKTSYKLQTPDLIQARYHFLFFSLLQKAEKIYFFYNENNEEVPSIFLKQLEFLFKDNPNKNFSYLNFSYNTKNYQVEAIIQEKDDDILEKIKEKLSLGIAPTILLNYLICPLKFYFKHILCIKSEEERTIDDELGADEFGTIIHNTLEEIYNKIAENHTPINIDKLQAIQKQKNEIQKSLLSNFCKQRNISNEFEPTGKNYFLLKVMEEIILQVLKLDEKRIEKNNEIQLLGLEQKLNSTLNIRGLNVNFKGTIDRMEKIGNEVFIIDYKSGKVESKFNSNENSKNKNTISFDETFLKYFSEEKITKNKELFQICFYAWLFIKQNVSKIEGNLNAGLLTFRDLKEGLKSIKIEKDKLQDFIFNFEKFITQKIEELLDPQAPFVQTMEEEENCKYCDYLKTCGKFHMIYA